MKIQIKNRWSLEVLFECEAATIRIAVEKAIEAKADLSKADLSWANLSEANLSKADLSKADLSKADLSWANLSEANLSWANLSKADLSKADLSWANLSEANLSEANLSWADLSKADLSKADLSKANLSKANLSEANLSEANLSWADLSKANLSKANLLGIKADFFSRLTKAKAEVGGLYKAVLDGKIDGSSYNGECSCFVGTVAKVRGCKYEELEGLIDLKPDSSTPTERFFMGISKGDSPDNNPVSAQVAEWIRAFAKENSIALPKRKIVWAEETA